MLTESHVKDKDFCQFKNIVFHSLGFPSVILSHLQSLLWEGTLYLEE